MSIDLSTEYLGLKLNNPLVVSACSLTESQDKLRQLEEAGAGAVVLPSLFEEQIEHEEVELTRMHEYGAESHAEAMNYFPEQNDYRFGPGNYLECVEAAKQAVSIPIIGSLNGFSAGGWVHYGKLIEEAGADALELNIYFIAADPDLTSEAVEQRYLQLVSEVKESISIPLAVKLGPCFSSIANMAKRLQEAGADGLVLFNRFLQPNIHLESLKISSELSFSTPEEMLLALRWIAILYKRVPVSLALTGGIHCSEGMLKSLLVGADVGMIASEFYQNGIGQIGKILDGMRCWMEENDYTSVEQLKGSVSQKNCVDPTAFERGNYMKALTSFASSFD